MDEEDRRAMTRTAEQLRRDALAIWEAGVEAVRSERLVRESARVEGSQLWIGEESLELGSVGRIAVVGAGKAGAGMAAAVEEVLGERWLREKGVTGWVNVPEDCVRELNSIHLHPARPAGLNEPTEAGVEGSRKILEMAGELGADDVCLCLISGGASALLPAPVEEITLADMQAVTQHLSGAGANIRELNTVRKQLSRVKGGGLARACRAGRLYALIISDVIGDPLDVIGSGPTVPDPARPSDALEVLKRFGARKAGISQRVFAYLEGKPDEPAKEPGCELRNLVIGNNATAVEAAGAEALRRGYSPAMHAARELEGEAEEMGRHLAGMALEMRREAGPDCLVTGGEPVVKLVAKERRGKGGRNQQLVLAGLMELGAMGQPGCEGIVLVSGGTDGEDGPTDAAGALADAAVARRARELGLEPVAFLERNDAYRFFEPVDGLIKTGPTHTNVCDVRVVVVDRVEDSAK